MRDRAETRSAPVTAVKPVAHPRPVLAPDLLGLISLQRTVGNAAVVQLMEVNGAEQPVGISRREAVTEGPARRRLAFVQRIPNRSGRSSANGSPASAGGLSGIPLRLAQPLVVQRKDPSVFTAQEVTQYRAQLTAGRQSTVDMSNKFNTFLKTAGDFITGFRQKTTWVNGAYSLAYDHHTTLVKVLAADDANRAVIANLVVGLGLNLATGGLAEVLEEAEMIGHAAAFWGDQISNTAVGVVGAPNIPVAAVSAETNPAFKELMGLQKLDELNRAVLPVAIDGSRNLLTMMAEVGDLSDALNASTNDPKAMGKDDFTRRFSVLQRNFQLVPQIVPTLDKVAASFVQLWATFFKSPWPDDRRSEQDIWIVWITSQVTSPESWSAAAWGSTLENYKLTNHLQDIGVYDRLGIVKSRTADWQLKAAANRQLADIAKYWASAFLQ